MRATQTEVVTWRFNLTLVANMNISQDDEWELDLAPADFEPSNFSLSTQDDDLDTCSVSSRTSRPRKSFKMTTEEDGKLRTLAEKYARDWSQISEFFPGKTSVQLKRRWERLQLPEGKRSRWTQEEDEALVALYKQKGGAWKVISQSFPGRTPEVVKNHFYSCLKKTLPEPPRPEFSSSPAILEPNDEVLFDMLATSSPPVPKTYINNTEKLQRIQNLQGALTSLESLLLSTKVELKRMEEEVRSRHK